MLSPELFLLLHDQQHQEMEQQAEHARLIQASRPTPVTLEHITQQFFWWAGGALLAWGCALKQVGHSPLVAEKGCWACP
jgi:hypothetical protein